MSTDVTSRGPDGGPAHSVPWLLPGPSTPLLPPSPFVCSVQLVLVLPSALLPHNQRGEMQWFIHFYRQTALQR